MNHDKNKIGVLLVNTGTPSELTTKSIRRYLKEFLSDKRVIQLPRFFWLPILYLFILVFRPRKKIKDYKKIWMENGSPLKVYTNKLLKKLNVNKSNKENIQIDVAMRYGNPNIKDKLLKFKEKKINNLIIICMFPQYSFTTTESIKDKIQSSLIDLKWEPSINYVEEYYKENLYLDAMCKNIDKNWEKKNQKLIFSYHGLPKNYINKGDPYYHACLETSELIAKKLKLKKNQYVTSFHSKFGFGEWTKPYTEDLIIELPRKGIRSISIVSPSFSIDCLETLEEIAIQFKEKFMKAGGEKFKYISCLNDQNEHVSLIKKLILLNNIFTSSNISKFKS